MSISLTNTTKNALNITNENKETALTWNDASWTWDEASGTWSQPEKVLTKISKNALNITNENKN